MKKEFLIVKNITREGPGLLEEVLSERSIPFNTVDLHRAQHFPPVENYGALIVLGGPDSANDTTDKMKNELQRIREVIRMQIPYLGICLGLQALVKAGGGNVVKNPIKEIGFLGPDNQNFTVELTNEGKQDALFDGLDTKFNVFHLHGETVELTKDMTLLGVGKFCRNQIVKVGPSAYGIQCHFELTPEMFETWMNEDPDLLKLNKEALRENFHSIKTEYEYVGKKLLTNFLHIAGF